MRYAALRTTRRHIAVFAAATALFAAAGCKKTVDDSTLSNNVRSALASDAAISKESIQPAVANGVVTLQGNVSSDTARLVAAEDAAKVSGVKEVVNNLSIAGATVTPTVTQPAAPAQPRPATPQERQVIAKHETLPPPAAAAPRAASATRSPRGDCERRPGDPRAHHAVVIQCHFAGGPIVFRRDHLACQR